MDSGRLATRCIVPKWRNWQTRVVQVHVLARVWGFESSRFLTAASGSGLERGLARSLGRALQTNGPGVSLPSPEKPLLRHQKFQALCFPHRAFSLVSNLAWNVAARLVQPPANFILLVRDGRRRPVQFGESNGELLVIPGSLVLENADSQRFPQHHRRIAVAAPVDTRVDSVTKRDVVRELVEFARRR